MSAPRILALALPAALLACSSDDGAGGSSSGGASSSGGDGGTPSACEVTGAIPDPLPLKVTVAGSTPQGAKAISGAVVEVRAYADDAVLATGNSGLDGTVEVSVATRGKPVPAFVRVARSGFVTARYGYQTGFAGGLTGDITVVLPTESDLVEQARSAGKTFTPKASSAVGITAYECTSKLRLTGATFQVTPGSGVVYRDRLGGFDPALATSTDTGSGTDFGAGAGRAKVRISRDGRSSELEVPIGAGELFGLIMSL